MRIYISGKITGNPEYMEEFARAENRLRWDNSQAEVINPAKTSATLPKEFAWDDYMRVALTLLDMADTIYLLPNWKESPEACIEYGYALAKGKMVINKNGQEEKSWEYVDNSTAIVPCKTDALLFSTVVSPAVANVLHRDEPAAEEKTKRKYIRKKKQVQDEAAEMKAAEPEANTEKADMETGEPETATEKKIKKKPGRRKAVTP